jgi:hypothetical protein
MKTKHKILLISVFLLASAITVHWCVAQSQAKLVSQEAANEHSVTLNQLQSLVSYLRDTKQTNVLNRFNNYVNASIMTDRASDLVITLRALRSLRMGDTNAAIKLLEVKLSGDIVGFATSYRALPASLREQVSLKPLEYAREYRACFRFGHDYPGVDDAITNAFKILNETDARQ